MSTAEGAVESDAIPVEPFAVSVPVSLTVAPPPVPARLLLTFVLDDGTIAARTFIDAAPVEEPNRRGARPATP